MRGRDATLGDGRAAARFPPRGDCRDRSDEPNEPRRSVAWPTYYHAAVAAGLALALYALTLAPTAWFWDSGEYIATAHTLGIPHPPGSPLFVLIGKAWSMLLSPSGLPVAVRMNLLAAVTSAAATGFLFLVSHRVLAGWLRGIEGRRHGEGPNRETHFVPLVGAWAGALLGATALTVWNQSNVNEKVYPLSLLCIAAVSWIAVLWLDRKDRPGSGWLLVLAVYLMVLGSTNHLMSVLPAPALLALVVFEKPAVLRNRIFLVHSFLAVLVGLSVTFFLPIRAAQQPVINQGEPTCETFAESAVAVYTFGRAGCPALAANLTRAQYGESSIWTDPTSSPLDPAPRSLRLVGHQFLTYFQYFDWQWGRGLAATDLPSGRRLPVSLAALGLGLWGLVVARRSSRGHALYLGTLALTLSVGLVLYLNFRFGYSLGPEWAGRELREVRERDYFFVASFHLWGFLAGMGLAAAWRWTAGVRATPRGLAFASPVLLVALLPLVANWSWASRAGDYSARDFAYNLLQSVEPYGILFTGGDNDTFPLWYLQEVEGVRRDVTVIVGEYLGTEWYPRQLRDRTVPGRQPAFSDREALGLYDAPESPPERSITRLTDTQIAGVGSVVLPDTFTVRLGSLAVEYPEGFVFTRESQVALAIIQDSIDQRPIHFAGTGGMARALGLDEWAVRRGLASKLQVTRPQGEPGIVRVSEEFGGEWMDLERSLQLAEDVYSYRGLRDRKIWADSASTNIPAQFYWLYVLLADATERSGGDPERVRDLLEEAERFGIVALGGSRRRADGS